MSAAPDIGIEGIGVWAPQWPDWSAARNMLCGNGEQAADSTRPTAAILPAGERRRAPESVLIAVEAAQQACAMARRDPRELAHVFASAYGDLAINDYLCATLARAPLEVSPTKFHNSVHNAAAGYWTIASGCMRASTAVSAGAASFGAGLLEAAVRAGGESEPVLLVAYDIAASGPLRDVIASRSAFAVALVLAPRSASALARLHLRLDDGAAPLAPTPPLLHASHRGNPAAASLPLLAALARREPGRLNLAAGPALSLNLEISI
ncbi:MAG: beta-ketoacyl synthase chain length factor [Xanthomonadaceae bacterium]|nr:beta-ketoacyl synthase chain length factor [Xanthomonadaceae bacterium]